jgi:hypothetical protein
MKTRTLQKATLNSGAALLVMLARVASNPVLLAHLTGRPYEVLKEYYSLAKRQVPLLTYDYIPAL